ncbi:MAG TPA: ATP-dependent Zn protease [Desulfarculaceae bacterium]|nr:ATP-dependent Zn protease [Desulfarculaceae bacterium]
MKINHKIFLLFIIASFGLGACAGQREEIPAPTVQIKEPVKKTTPEKTVTEIKPEPEKVEKKIAPVPTPKTAPPTTIKSDGEKLIIIGETEYITIKPGNIRLKARIDTGATTSSIHALDIVRYERDGKKWVRFNLINSSGAKIKMNYPVHRIIKIKRHGADVQSRPVVNLKITMGKIQKTTPFSLIDRSNFNFPILIGRTFLANTAIVDVNRSYILSPLSGDKDDK